MFNINIFNITIFKHGIIRPAYFLDSAWKSLFHIFFILLVSTNAPPGRAGELQPWILIDTANYSLTVFSANDKVIVRFYNIAIGSGGAAKEHLRGDDTTPLGTFHVAWINRHSRFGTFFGLDYPTSGLTVRAYRDGVITETEFDNFVGAFRHHRLPPQNTLLGGQIGIHGVGSGNPRVQEAVDWTDGCVAVTNREIGILARWVYIGTKVVIR